MAATVPPASGSSSSTVSVSAEDLGSADKAQAAAHVQEVLGQILPASPHGTGSRRPLNIAHRGFRARWPENSLEAFRQALAPTTAGGGGADALETDIHLSRDGVVVLSHDPTLRRCFDRPERIADCDWFFLAEQRSTQAPGEPLARLEDLLRMLSEPAYAAVWVLLDVKRDDDPDVLLRRVAETLATVPGDWSRRIVLGCWEAIAMRICHERLPAFPVAYIGFSLKTAELLLRHHPDIVQVFNLNLHQVLRGRGVRFLRASQRTRKHRVLAWTVNDPEWMEWCIRHRVDGVISDDPSLFFQVRGEDTEPETETETEVDPAKKTAPYPHPPSTTSFTGWYIRRWAHLLAVAGKFRTFAFMFGSLWQLRQGSWESQLRKALGPRVEDNKEPALVQSA